MTIRMAKLICSSTDNDPLQHVIRFFVSSLCIIFMLPCLASDRYVPGSAVPKTFDSFAKPFNEGPANQGPLVPLKRKVRIDPNVRVQLNPNGCQS